MCLPGCLFVCHLILLLVCFLFNLPLTLMVIVDNVDVHINPMPYPQYFFKYGDISAFTQ